MKCLFMVFIDLKIHLIQPTIKSFFLIIIIIFLKQCIIPPIPSLNCMTALSHLSDSINKYLFYTDLLKGNQLLFKLVCTKPRNKIPKRSNYKVCQPQETELEVESKTKYLAVHIDTLERSWAVSLPFRGSQPLKIC